MDELGEAQERLGRALERARAGEDRVLATVVREEGERLVKLQNGLLGMARLHSLDNHAFDQPIRDLEAVLARLVQLLGAVHLLTVEDQVYVNDIRIRLEGGDAAQDLGAKLRRHGVGGISFHAALGGDRLRELVAAVAGAPDPDRPRPALQAKLGAKGMDCVELAGMHRFRVSGEDGRPETRDPARISVSAAALVDEACANVGSNRLPNPLPLRRVVIEILQASSGADALWDDPDGASAYSTHTLRVCRLALQLGRALRLSEGALQDLGVAAMFHDVGYAAREGAELHNGQASGGYAPPFERHSTAGARLLLRQRGFHEAKVRRVLATLDHHRRYDDPRGRPSLLGRLLAVVEDYDTWLRPAGGSAAPDRALARLAGGAGTVYDPVLVQLFVNVLGRRPPGTLFTLRDGRKARVVSFARSPETFDAPRVRIEALQDGSRPAGEVLVDLARHRELLPEDRAVPDPRAHAPSGSPARSEPPVAGSPPPRGTATASSSVPAPGPKPGGRPRPLVAGALPQVLREIHLGRKSGRLRLARGDTIYDVEFGQGEIVSARCAVAGEPIGDLAVRENILTALAHAIPWRTGSYEFEPLQEPRGREERPFPGATAELMLLSARALEDADLIACVLGDLDRLLLPSAEALAGGYRLDPLEGFVLSRADGTLTAREIVSIVPGESEQARRALFTLLCVGLIHYRTVQGR